MGEIISRSSLPPLPDPIHVWGLPLCPLDTSQTLARAEALIEARKPSYFITANLNYAMLCDEDPTLEALNSHADFLVADGMPLVWAAKGQGTPLPERVAGADLVVHLCERAAAKGYRIYILGGPPNQAEEAGRMLEKKYPGFILAGTDCPPFRRWTPEDIHDMEERIRQARPDILFVAFGQPKGERWILEKLEPLQVPLSLQIGGSFDFVTGRLKRAPRWMQKTGLEWVYRFLQEPRRLGTRYAKNIWFVWRMTLGSLFSRKKFRRNRANPLAKRHLPEKNG